MNNSIAVIILTYNEEIHINRCIRSVRKFVNDIYVIDSFSEDNTINIAKEMGAKVFQNPFVNHAAQFNWALENCPIENDWIWRIDADEYADESLVLNLQNQLYKVSNEITGIYIRRGIVFMDKLLRHGTWAPRWTLKMFRRDAGYCENKWMDEHIVLKYGESMKIEGYQIDENLNDLTWWTSKHNKYSTKEMVELLMPKNNKKVTDTVSPILFGTNEQRNRWLKLRYSRFPLFIRPFINFFYRYIFRFGFLDGKQGFIWHVLQGFWYRFLVDVKIFELRLRFQNDKKQIEEYLKESYLDK